MDARSGKIFLIYLCLIVLFTGCSNTGTSTGKTAETDTTDYTAVRVSSKDADAAEPAIAADSAGDLFVVYVLHEPGGGANVFLQKLDSNTKPVANPVRVNSVAGSAKAWKGDPPTIAIGSDNAIYIGWTRTLADTNAKGNDLMLSKSTDGGRTFTGAVKVNDDAKPASHGMHSLAVDNAGRVYLAWLDERNIVRESHDMDMSMMHHEESEPNSEIFYAVSADGGRTFSANKKIASDACPCCKTNLATSSDGIVFASWRQVLPGSFRHIAVARSEDNGVSFSAPVIVSDDKWKIDACPVSGAALGVDEKGTLSVAWYAAGSEGQPGLYMAESGDRGKTFTPRSLVSPDAISGTPVLLPDQGKLVLAAAEVGNAVLVGQWNTSAKAVGESAIIKDASLPAAAVAGDRVFAAYVHNDGQRREIWLRRVVGERKSAA